MTTHDCPGNPPISETDIIIVGAGFAGLGMGIQLARRKHESFVILERNDDVGGTWRDNHYPGVACDVPSHLYSFSFRPNPSWSRVYSPGAEIQSYLRECARDEGLLPHLYFGADMLSARWDDRTSRWRVDTPRGLFISRILVTATGHLADEHLPRIDGLCDFPGEVFHSARWNHGVPLRNRRVGVVGSGASAIQIVPEMAKLARQLVVFQRSAPFVVPRADRSYSMAEQRTFARDPVTMAALRENLFWTSEYNFAVRRNIPRYLEETKALALAHLERQVADPHLRALLTPDYEIGCKRLLISNDFYPALAQSHVTLEPSALLRIKDGKAVSTSGQPYDLDVLIFATGFEATRPPFAKRIFGRNGLCLDAHWSEGMKAHDSIAVHGFPNAFIINGPNTSLGHNSVIYVVESQVQYILGALDHARKNDIEVLEADHGAQQRYLDALDRRSQGTVWLAGGCKSWYVDPRSGRLTLVWPDFAHSFREENGRFRAEGYVTRNVRTALSDIAQCGDLTREGDSQEHRSN